MQRFSRYLSCKEHGIGEFQAILKYCKGLKFEEDPDYMFIKQQLRNAFTRSGFDYDFAFDWNMHLIGKKGIPAAVTESKEIHETIRKSTENW